MTSSYSILFDLEVRHTYFETGFCQGLVYSFSNDTKQLIDRFNFKLFITDKGFQFYFPQENAIEAFLNHITAATGISHFEFNTNAVDQAFYQYTNLPIDANGGLLFDSSQGDSEPSFIVLKQQFQQELIANDLFKLRISFADVLKSKGNGFPVHYKINFFSRATKWQYNIINSSQQNFNQLSIKGAADIEFDSGKEVVLQNGQVATCFSSIQDILFSQVPKYSFDLIGTTETLGVQKETTIFKGLPMPNPKQLQVSTEHTQKVLISPMYVYI
nr:hypothetical protein [uncultured Psychroserpens sp.]